LRKKRKNLLKSAVIWNAADCEVFKINFGIFQIRNFPEKPQNWKALKTTNSRIIARKIPVSEVRAKTLKFGMDDTFRRDLNEMHG
jgi:hypothetical protein